MTISLLTVIIIIGSNAMVRLWMECNPIWSLTDFNFTIDATLFFLLYPMLRKRKAWQYLWKCRRILFVENVCCYLV